MDRITRGHTLIGIGIGIGIGNPIARVVGRAKVVQDALKGGAVRSFKSFICIDIGM